MSCGLAWFWQCDVVQVCARSHVSRYKIRCRLPPSRVTRLRPSITTRACLLDSFAVALRWIVACFAPHRNRMIPPARTAATNAADVQLAGRSEEHTSELQSPVHLVCRLLLEKKKQ